ncbi:hypothetical protein SNE40_010505 [Patella caerulea]|uniref:Uncharacterized protein n=1 Tax=Patella caerulea TaxID=87958 RepID=A0AAN8K166_PATCE
MDVFLNPKRRLMSTLGFSLQVLFSLMKLPYVLTETTTEMMNDTTMYTGTTPAENQQVNKEGETTLAVTTTPLPTTTEVTTTTTVPQSTTLSLQEQEAFLTHDMIQGLAAGFGFFFGTIILIVLLWCLCCSNACSRPDKPQKLMRPKVGPSPTPKGTSRNSSR